MASKKKAKPVRKAAAKTKAAAIRKKPAPTKKKASPKPQPLDLSGLPPESLTQYEKSICLACVLDVFTRHLKLTLRAAWLEIRRYEPPVSELQAGALERPYFHDAAACPYCGSAPRWHARLPVVRIESGKSTDAARRALVKSLPATEGRFLILEEKATQQHAFYEWLDKISAGFNLDDPAWLRDVSLHYLSRIDPKVEWLEQFKEIQAIRRSRRLAEGWEHEAGRLFLAPMLFDELLLVQYLVSRSQKAGGLTLEGRYTLPELFGRLRNSGYLRHAGVDAANPSDALEMLLARLSGGESSLKLHYIVDRREYLEKAKALKETKPPKPKPAAS